MACGLYRFFVILGRDKKRQVMYNDEKKTIHK